MYYSYLCATVYPKSEYFHLTSAFVARRVVVIYITTREWLPSRGEVTRAGGYL